MSWLHQTIVEPIIFHTHTQKFATHCKEQKKKNHNNWLKTKKLFKVKKCFKKCPKNSKFLVQKYIKVLKFKKKPKTLLNKGTELKKLYGRSKLKK